MFPPFLYCTEFSIEIESSCKWINLNFPPFLLISRVFRVKINLSVLSRNKGLEAFFPYHDEERRRELFAKWVKPCTSPNAQPLDEIKVLHEPILSGSTDHIRSVLQFENVAIYL